MIINIFKTFILASNILLLDYYFIAENIRIMTLSICLLILFYFIDYGVIKRDRIFTLEEDTSKIIKASFLFVAYIVLIDLYHNHSIYKTMVFAFSSIITISLLPIFENRQIPYNFIRRFKLLMIISMAFSLIQFITSNNNIILSNIISGFGIMGVDQAVDLEIFTDNYFRTTGATSNNIGFTIQLSIFIIIEYVTFMQFRRPKEIISILASFFILITTQTRAALFSIAPVIFAIQMLFIKLKKKRQIAAVIIFWVFFISIGYFALDFILTKMTYIGRNIMEKDMHRFTTNWIMTIGVLKESPLFGISPERAWDIYLQYGGDVNHYLSAHYSTAGPTHHNQLGFYLRYYGLIGVFFLCWLYVLIFKKIMRAKSFWIGVALGSIFIFDLVFSMAHNNKLLASPLLWIFLSLASIDPENEESPL